MSDDSLRFAGDGEGMTFSSASTPGSRPRTDVSDGDQVSARELVVRESLRVLSPPATRTVRGALAIEFVELTGGWRYSVTGVTVDPATIVPTSTSGR